jgi:hypothetical protein
VFGISGVETLGSDTRGFHVNIGPCQHGMVHPQVADGGDGLQICSVAASMLNKQLQTTDKRVVKTPASYRMLHRASQLGGFFGTT